MDLFHYQRCFTAADRDTPPPPKDDVSRESWIGQRFLLPEEGASVNGKDL